MLLACMHTRRDEPNCYRSPWTAESHTVCCGGERPEKAGGEGGAPCMRDSRPPTIYGRHRRTRLRLGHSQRSSQSKIVLAMAWLRQEISSSREGSPWPEASMTCTAPKKPTQQLTHSRDFGSDGGPHTNKRHASEKPMRRHTEGEANRARLGPQTCYPHGADPSTSGERCHTAGERTTDSVPHHLPLVHRI